MGRNVDATEAACTLTRDTHPVTALSSLPASYRVRDARSHAREMLPKVLKPMGKLYWGPDIGRILLSHAMVLWKSRSTVCQSDMARNRPD